MASFLQNEDLIYENFIKSSTYQAIQVFLNTKLRMFIKTVTVDGNPPEGICT